MTWAIAGYAAAATNRDGLMGADAVLLNKPFQTRELAEKIRAELDR